MAAENRQASADFVIEVLEDLSVNENEPDSVGGISKGGVTLFDYADFCKATGLPVPSKDTIRNLTEDQIRSVYEKQFMGPLRFDDLPGGVDCAVFGFAVQAGIHGGVELLALATGFWPVPVKMTDDLMAHVKTMDARAVIGAISGAWSSRKFDTGRWEKYGRGWSNRLLKQDSKALAMVKP